MTSVVTQYVDNLIVGNIDAAPDSDLFIGSNAKSISIGGQNTSVTSLSGNVVGTTNPIFVVNLGGEIENLSNTATVIYVYNNSNIVGTMILGNCEGNTNGTTDSWIFETPTDVYGINQNLCRRSNVEFGYGLFLKDALITDIPPTSSYGVVSANFMSVHSGTIPDPTL